MFKTILPPFAAALCLAACGSTEGCYKGQYGYIYCPPAAAAADINDCGATQMKIDPNKAVAACRRLADDGNSGAQYNLGVAYEHGDGMPRDYVEAAKWYRIAANSRLAPAQNNLGILYESGWGVPQDFVRAYMWLSLSAAQGNANAANHRDLMVAKMTGSQIDQAKALASAWQPTAEQ